MLTELFKQRANQALERPVRQLARRGLSPNVLTITGLALNAVVGLVLALGWEFAGGFLVIFAGLFDMLDGALARMSGRTTRFGALLDSVVDRFSEAAILVGLLWFYLSSQRLTEVLLLFAVLLGSLMVSYVRARAEGLGIDCEVGLLARPERVLLLALGLIVSQMVIVLLLLAILTHATVIQRVWHVWRRTGRQEMQKSSDNPPGEEPAPETGAVPGQTANPPVRRMA